MRVVATYITACKIIGYGSGIQPSTLAVGTAHGLPLSWNAIGAIRYGPMQDITMLPADGTNRDRSSADGLVAGDHVSHSYRYVNRIQSVE
jgi:hypothetical protein